jgi:hypothetical protein
MHNIVWTSAAIVVVLASAGALSQTGWYTMAATKQKAGPLTKPYFIEFHGFPESAAESPFLSANLPIETKNLAAYPQFAVARRSRNSSPFRNSQACPRPLLAQSGRHRRRDEWPFLRAQHVRSLSERDKYNT